MVCCYHGVKKSLTQLSNWWQQNRDNLNILLRRFSEAACVKHTSVSRILKGLRFYPTDKFHPTNKLTCCSFTDASKRHKTPGSEMNDFITQSLVVARGSVMMLVAWALLPKRRSPDSQVEPAHAVDLLQEEILISGDSKVNLLLWCGGNNLCIVQGFSLYKYPWKESTKQRQSGHLFARSSVTQEIHWGLLSQTKHGLDYEFSEFQVSLLLISYLMW